MCLSVANNIPVFNYIFFSVAVQENQPILSMRCKFKRRSYMKFAFMFFTVFAIGALFVNVLTPLPLDPPGHEDGLQNIEMETGSNWNRFLGKYSKLKVL